MSNNQKMIMIQRIQYLRYTYHNLLECDVNHRIKFIDCCERAIKQMETVGVKLINNYQILMRWNRVSRLEECFPHPNPSVENNRTYQPVLFEFFPQLKIEITRWAKTHLDKFSCEVVELELREKK